MSWQTIVSNISIVIALLAVIVSIRSIDLARRVATKETTSLIFQDWWGEELRQLRKYFFYDFLPNHREKLVGKGMKEIDQVIPEDKGKVTKLCYFFDRVGWLGAAGLIDVDYVLGPMQHTMRRTWIVMESLIKKEREPMPDKIFDPVFQYGFEWLFNRSNQPRKHQSNLLKYRFLSPRIFSHKETLKLKVQIEKDEKNFRLKLEEILSKAKKVDVGQSNE